MQADQAVLRFKQLVGPTYAFYLTLKTRRVIALNSQIDTNHLLRDAF